MKSFSVVHKKKKHRAELASPGQWRWSSSGPAKTEEAADCVAVCLSQRLQQVHLNKCYYLYLLGFN